MEKKDFAFEQEKLKSVLQLIAEQLNEEKSNLQRMFNDFIGSREELWRMADFKKVHIANLEASLDNPYFARIDFREEGEEKPHPIYIGKNGVMKDANIVVTDWRAPISSLYYDAELGKCQYEAPDGIIKGDLDLKRQFEIEEGELQDYYDVDLVSNDSLLQKYLNTNNDARLKSIVATIQKEQNDVIRKKMMENLIIQGVAGSGKTTVALHRIAYLVYNYLKTVRQNQYLVIGPNPVFLKYIKSVLPELDVSGVEQCTFEGFAKDYIEEDITIRPSEKKVVASIAGKGNDIDKFKCSMEYQKMLENFLQVFMRSLTDKPLMLGDFQVLSPEEIQKVFEETNDPKFYNTLGSRINYTIERLCRLIEAKEEDLESSFTSLYYDKFREAQTKEEKEAIQKTIQKGREELRKNGRNLLKRYFNKAKIEPTKVYKLFISTIEDFNSSGFKNIKSLKKETTKNIKEGSYDFEDLAALIYIKSVLSPDRSYQSMKHVVVDEAQDLGEFNFYVLRKALPNATFSIFGDLAQSIYDYRGINNWEEVNQAMFQNKGEIVNFNKSYRTTAEIMDAADDVAESIGLNRSDMVIRHGEPVQLTGVEKRSDIPEKIAKKLEELKKKGYKNIAIISKTNLLSNYINDDLAALGIDIPNVGPNDDVSDERFKVCTISNQLAKGLEFDAVIINDAGEDIYSSDNPLDMKLLYVALTRALHELDIVYAGELTKPLQGQLEKQKQYIKQ